MVVETGKVLKPQLRPTTAVSATFTANSLRSSDTDHTIFKDEIPSGFTWSEVVWYNVIVLIAWHLGAIYALFFRMPHCSLLQLSVLWGILWFVAGLGITAGAHRLWSHRCYRAKLPLRVFLMLCNSMAFQGSIFEWSRDHRVHHKGSDTTADPHNSERGLFFSHMGWVMVRKHKNVRKAGFKLDFTDLLADSVVTFQRKHYMKTAVVMCYVVPTIIGYYLGDACSGFWVGGVFRHVWVLHMTWMVNSVAHVFGYKPYDLKLKPVENLIVAIGALGEGYHNYHHKFPSDYATSEWGILNGQFNPTKAFIDLMANIGQAYDLKRSRTAVKTRQRVAQQLHKDSLKLAQSPTISWWERQLNQVFFGKTEAQVFL